METMDGGYVAATSLAACWASASPVQRMGLLAGGKAWSMHGQYRTLSPVCLDEHPALDPDLFTKPEMIFRLEFQRIRTFVPDNFTKMDEGLGRARDHVWPLQLHEDLPSIGPCQLLVERFCGEAKDRSL